MVDTQKAPEHTMHLEEGVDMHVSAALPPGVKVDGGVLLDAGGKNELHLKLAKDGHVRITPKEASLVSLPSSRRIQRANWISQTVLLPQPSENAEDPLLWPSWKKHAMLFTLAYGAFVADAVSGECTSLIVAQGTEWQMNPNTVNHANTLNILLLYVPDPFLIRLVNTANSECRSGVSALFFVPLSTWWGRAPTIFWAALIACFLNLGVALSPDWHTYYITRVVQGLFSNAPPSIAIAFIRDIFFFHERARKIGLWTALFIASPYCGPLFGNFMLAGLDDWRPVLWLGFAMQAVFLVTCILFLDETWYNRDVADQQQPRRGAGFFARMSRVTGTWQIRHHNQFFTLRHSVVRFVQAILKPVLVVVFFN